MSSSPFTLLMNMIWYKWNLYLYSFFVINYALTTNKFVLLYREKNGRIEWTPIYNNFWLETHAFFKKRNRMCHVLSSILKYRWTQVSVFEYLSRAEFYLLNTTYCVYIFFHELCIQTNILDLLHFYSVHTNISSSTWNTTLQVICPFWFVLLPFFTK